MKQSDVLERFEALEKRKIRYTLGSGQILGGARSGQSPIYYDISDASDWLTTAGWLLSVTFPPSHFLHQQWHKAVGARIEGAPHMMADNSLLEAAQGIVRTATAIIKSNGLSTLVEGVRAESTKELLDQAEILLASGFLVAAAVIAGGALEMHLLHYCNRHGLTWNGDGSIGKYDGAVAQARNNGQAGLYQATDSKLVGGWGGLRNDAAHSPGTFAHSKNDGNRSAGSGG